jgi:hypothetical protein
MPLTQDGLRASLRQAFSWLRPFAESPSDVQVFGDGSVNAGIGTLLRPIATPLSFGGFEPGIIDPVASAFRDQGFATIVAVSSQVAAGQSASGLP